MTAPELVIVGRLRKAHGLRGDMIVEPITDTPAEVFTEGRRFHAGTTAGDPLPEARALVVTAVRPFQRGLFIVHFDAIHDRTEAERWRDHYLLSPRSELTPPGEHEVYYHELVGMRVVSASGAEVGTVVDLYELPQGLALGVAGPRGPTVIPFRPEFVRALDKEEARVVVDLPDGWVD